MSDEPAIEVSHVTKRFNLSAGGGSIKTAVLDLLHRNRRKTFTALDDVSFTVGRGETLGVVGFNGAGKSTLLSIIAGTMYATSGSVATHGVVSSLLELGAGFHPDLTGRENVYLYGSIMNIPKSVMRQRFDDIVDFAGIGEFIDQPVRFYSSGMYVRLGFAVAVQVDPDILLIDEVLAVGDDNFQKQCIKKMDEFRKLGKTMLVISHDLGTVCDISDRVLFLDHGRIQGIGDPETLVDRYRAASEVRRRMLERDEWGTKEVVLTSTELIDAEGRPCGNAVPPDRQIRVRVSYEASRRIETPTFGFAIADRESKANVFGYNTELAGVDVPFIEGKGHVVIAIDATHLHGGNYILSFSVHSRDHKVNYHRLDRALPVLLEKDREFDGIVRLPVRFQLGGE